MFSTTVHTWLIVLSAIVLNRDVQILRFFWGFSRHQCGFYCCSSLGMLWLWLLGWLLWWYFFIVCTVCGFSGCFVEVWLVVVAVLAPLLMAVGDFCLWLFSWCLVLLTWILVVDGVLMSPWSLRCFCIVAVGLLLVFVESLFLSHLVCFWSYFNSHGRLYYWMSLLLP